MVILEIFVVVERFGGAASLQTNSAHFRCEVACRTGIDASLVGSVGIGNRIRGAHIHAFPGGWVGEETFCAILDTGGGEVISPTAWRTLIQAKSCDVFCKAEFFHTVEGHVEEASFMADSSIIISISEIWTFSETSIGGIVSIK